MTGYKRITNAQRRRVIRNANYGIKEKTNALMVGISIRSVQRILGTYGLRDFQQCGTGVVITNRSEECQYEPGDKFMIDRVRVELYYGNMPDGLTMKFSDGHTAEVQGSQLMRDDGLRMILRGIAKHRWG